MSKSFIPIQITKNVFPPAPVHKYKLKNIELLIQDAKSILKLQNNPKKAYSENGTLITNPDQVKPHSIVYISCGEPFARPQLYQKEPPITKQDSSFEQNERRDLSEDQPLFRNSFIKSNHSILFVPPTSNTASFGRHEFSYSQQPKHYDNFKQTKPISDQEKRDDALVAYTTVEFSQRPRVHNHQSLQILLQTTQQQQFHQKLIRSGLRNLISSPIITKKIADFIEKTTYHIPIEDINFVIAGPRKSGKSSIFYTLCKSLYKQITETSESLVVLLNLDQLRLTMDSVPNLFKTIITAVIENAMFCCYRFRPISKVFLTYMLSNYSLEAVGSVPPSITSLKWINSQKVQKIIRNFSELYCKKNLSGFVEALWRFPSDLAEALGMRNVIWMIDHFDSSFFKFEDRDNFPEQTVDMGTALVNEVVKNPFVVSSQTEKMFPLFPTAGKTVIDTFKFIRDYDEKRNLGVIPSFDFSADDLMGIPGYLSEFTEICDSVEKIKSSYVNVTTVAASRLQVIKTRVVELCTRMKEIGVKKVNDDIIQMIIDTKICPLVVF